MTQPITHAPDCAIALNPRHACSCGAETATPRTDALLKRDRTTDDETDFMRQLERELAEALAQRDEARKQLAAWKEAMSAAAMGKLAWFPSIQQIPADESAIRAIVDAIENEHRHVEKLLGLYSCTTVNAALLDAKERIKSLAGLLERLVMPALVANAEKK